MLNQSPVWIVCIPHIEFIGRSRIKNVDIKHKKRPAKNKKKVFNNKTALIEIVKYGSKIITEPDDSHKKENNHIYIAALHNIFDAMRGLRIFERFGFNIPVKFNEDQKLSFLTAELQEWIFTPQYFDWLNAEHESPLSSYRPPESLIELLKNNINSILE